MPSQVDTDDGVRPAGRRFRNAARGEVAIEYGLIAALVVVALIAALPLLNAAATMMYNKINNAMSTTAR